MKICEADALLVCNFTKKGIENYIGANTFLEMATPTRSKSRFMP